MASLPNDQSNEPVTDDTFVFGAEPDASEETDEEDEEEDIDYGWALARLCNCHVIM